MWELLAAILGIIYLFCKSAPGIRASKRWDRETAAWEQALGEWKAKVVDIDLERKTNLFIRNHPDEAKRLANEICPCIPECQQNHTTYLRVLLAQRGKIYPWDAGWGIDTPSYSDMTKVQLPVRDQLIQFHEYVLCLKKIQEENGLESMGMVFDSKSHQAGDPQYYELYDIENCLTFGKYEWVEQDINAYKDTVFKKRR